MEYCGGGDLQAYLKKRQAVDEPEAVRLLTQLLVALKFIHGQGVSHVAACQQKHHPLSAACLRALPWLQVAHRDVKPANILLTSAGDLKLADLGLARNLNESSAAMKSASKGAAGTFAYLPPEAWESPPQRTFAGDVWSAGVVALQLTSLDATPGDAPIGLGEQTTVSSQVGDRLSALFGSVTPPYLEAVRCMLTFVHAERATASELLCEAAFYEAATKLRDAKDLVELHSIEEDAKKLAAKKQAAAEAQAERVKAAAEADEQARVLAGGCAAGGEHKWQVHTGRHGYGRACFKCLEVQDMATGEKIWWCSTVDERKRILAGGCPAGGPFGDPPDHHAWQGRNGQKGSGRMCTRCGQTENSGGAILLLPQLVGAFGPAVGDPRAGGR